MELEKIEKIEKSVENLKNKISRIYFLVQDTKGNPKASVKYIYDVALTLKNNGYNTIIIHETNDYKGVSEWIDDRYNEIPHQSIDGQNLAISPEDFIVIPEVYGHVMDQVKGFPCGKIVLCQAYDHMLETVPPITPKLDPIFSKKDKPSKPIISIHTREQRDTAKIIKSFYLKYPQYRWITFRDMRGIKQDDFAKFLKESYVSVWVDLESGFGTYPLESMACGTPVIGKVPSLKPEWMDENNGVWTYEFNDIIDVVANFTQNWLEDNISESLYENMKITSDIYSKNSTFESTVISTFEEYFEKRGSSFSEQLEKIKETEQN